jgi:hypothetical protein
VRRASSRLPAVGEIVRLTVGPRPAFAYARIIAAVPVDLEALSDGRRAQVLGCYGVEDGPFVRLSFEICESTGESTQAGANHDRSSKSTTLHPGTESVVAESFEERNSALDGSDEVGAEIFDDR